LYHFFCFGFVEMLTENTNQTISFKKRMHIMIEEMPSFGTSLNTEYILRMAKTGGSIKILLDINKILSGDKLKASDSAGGV
jgi:chemotaxis signal transduction protein